MSLTPPEKLQKLQAALHAKAKASPDQRFHALYDKVYRKDVLGRTAVTLRIEELVVELNPVLRGWAGYFCLGPITDAYRTINSHVRYRLRQWWKAKHKTVQTDGRGRWSSWLEQEFGLLELKWDPSRLPNAKA